MTGILGGLISLKCDDAAQNFKALKKTHTHKRIF